MRSEQRPHDQIEELIAADALDGLDENGRRELVQLRAEHGPDCAQCLLLESEYRQVASQLAAVVEPVGMSAGAEEALIRAARSPSVTPRESAPPRLGVVRGGGRVQKLVAAVAVAAAIALLGGLAGYAVSPKPAPLARVTYRSGAQQLTIVYVKGQTQALAVGSLPALSGGRVYELWYQPRAGANMVPAGTFVPQNGTVVAPVVLGESFVAVAMSVEPAGGSPQPTTTPIFVKPV
jgi:anti-sigma-K factor RskA